MASPDLPIPSDAAIQAPVPTFVPHSPAFSGGDAHDFRTAVAAMNPAQSDTAAKVVPEMLIDAGTADALTKIDIAGIDAAIPPGGGPFQALRPHFSRTDISDHDLAGASSIIRDTRMAGHTISAGEAVPIGRSYLAADVAAENEADLRQSLHMPFNATDDQVNARIAADEAAALRQSLHMPADATNAQVDARISADSAASLRTDLGLPLNASDADVQAKLDAKLNADLDKLISSMNTHRLTK